MTGEACCTPGRGGAPGEPRATTVGSSSVGPGAGTRVPDLIDVPAGTFTMGTDEPTRWPADGEGPAREVALSAYRIGRTTVTNDHYAAFVDATGHETDAERYGWSFVFHLLLPDDFPPTRGVAAAPWWRQVHGADWRHPAGPQSDLDDIGDHPVVHVSWNDAVAYCDWAGVRLPTEAEWERAARGGLEGARYAWGDELRPDGRTMCNIFEGTFPTENTAEDGFVGTAPADAFPPNGFGLHHTAGNVWEWCGDWFDPSYHRTETRSDPLGPPTGAHKVIRGGSYLCHDSYCDRYRVTGRTSNEPDATTGHMGFRVAAGAD